MPSYQVYYFGNLVFVDRIGDMDMTMEFDKQKTFDLRKKVALALWLVLTVILVVPKWERRSSPQRRVH